MERTRIRWRNTNDLDLIVYSGGADTIDGQTLAGTYYNIIYFDEDVLVQKPEYSIDEQVQQNHELKEIFQSQKWRKTYKAEIYVPEFLADALTMIPLHDEVYIHIKDEDDEQQVETINVNIEWVGEFQSCYARATLEWTFKEVLKTSCMTDLYTIRSRQWFVDVFDEDGWANTTDSVLSNNAHLKFGRESSKSFDAWMLYKTVVIPSNAVIVEARLQFTGWGSAGTPKGRIYLCTNSAVTKPNNYADYAALTFYPTYVGWDNVEAFTLDDEFSSPDLSQLLQPMISGWTLGFGNLLLAVKNNAAGANNYNEAYALDDDVAKSCRLRVLYYVP